MKSLTYIALWVLLTSCLHAVSVKDSTTHTLLQKNNSSQLARWGEQLNKMKEQLDVAKDYLDKAKAVKEAIGDPTQIAALIDSEVLGGELGNLGVGQTLNEVTSLVGDVQELSESGKELFAPIDFKNPLEGFENSHDPYKKFEAFRNTWSNFEKVSSDVSTRRQTIKEDINRITRQLNNASTDAEVQKLKGNLQAQQAALNALKAEEESAANNVKTTAAAIEQEEKISAHRQATRIRAGERESVENSDFENSRPTWFLEMGRITNR